MRRFQLDGFTAELPPGWCHITEDSAAPVLTLARKDGVGALQFSVALYAGGERPAGTVGELQSLLDRFADCRALGPMSNALMDHGPPAVAAGTFEGADDLLRVWYVSTGGDFAFVTYTCTCELFRRAELAEAEAIVRSIHLGSPVAG